MFDALEAPNEAPNNGSLLDPLERTSICRDKIVKRCCKKLSRRLAMASRVDLRELRTRSSIVLQHAQSLACAAVVHDGADERRIISWL